jgi:hypothetical protein
MKNNKKNMSMNDRNHLLGRIFLSIALVIIILIPVIMAFALQTTPDFKVILKSMLPLIVFIIGGFAEVITYSPLLGTNGTYLGFFTGNLVNLKVPCAVNAREQANVKHGSQEGEIVSTVSIATSTIVTTIIIALGVALLVPLTPILESETLKPAFNAAFTALFGALAYKYFVKDLKLVPAPLLIAIILEIFIGLGTGVLIPLCSIISILVAYLLFRNEMKKKIK